MSDRSSARVTVYAIADGTADQVRDVLVDYGFEAEFADERSLEDGLTLGQEYTVEELILCRSADVADELAALGATFEVSQEAHFNNYAGQVFRHTPTLGMYSADGSETGGDPLVSADAVDKAVAATQDRDELVAALAQLTGGPWLAEFAAAEKSLAAGMQLAA